MSRFDFISFFFPSSYSQKKIEHSEEIEKELDKISKEEE